MPFFNRVLQKLLLLHLLSNLTCAKGNPAFMNCLHQSTKIRLQSTQQNVESLHWLAKKSSKKLFLKKWQPSTKMHVTKYQTKMVFTKQGNTNLYEMIFCSRVTKSRAGLYDTLMSPTPQHLHSYHSYSHYFPVGY